MRNFKFIAFVLAIVGMMSFATGVGFGQVIDGNVVGTILDSQGAAVVGADVSATNVATGVVATAKTNGSGEYRFDHLPVGTYKITAKTTGFKSISERVDVELNKTSTRNLSLTPGATSETVEVSGTPPTIDTTTSQIQSTYDQKELQDLPTASIGLGVLNLSLLQAGVASTGNLGVGTGPSVGGQRPRNNSFDIEGVDNNDKGVTGPLISVPNDAVANLSILQNNFSPELGHSSGAQFNTVIVSGTNSWHGRVYEYFQNRNLNAIDQSIVNSTPVGQTPKNPRYDNNRYGGQVGGPIFKNKLFFFVNYERQGIGQAAVLASPPLAPTAAGYTALLAMPGANTTTISALQTYAQASVACTLAQTTGSAPICPAAGGVTVNGTDFGGASGLLGPLNIIAPNFQNFKVLVTSMDYDISSKDQLRGRYIYNKSAIIDTGAELPVFYELIPQPFHLVSISEYHTFTSALANEFRIGFNRTGNNFPVPAAKFANLDAFPNIQIDELNTLNVGPDPNAPQFAVQNLYQAVDNVSWVRGNHSLKFGVEGRKSISPQKFIQRSRGDYEYFNLQSFVNDVVPDFAERSFGATGYSGDLKAFYWFVNDVWKVRSNLTLNLGLRYEYTGTPFGWTQQSLNSVASAPGLITIQSPVAPKTDFMPRVGFAYSPGTSGNTSIRGGFFMGYDVLYDNIGTLSRPPELGNTTIDCPNPAISFCANNFLANGGIPPQTATIGSLDQATARAETSSYLPANVRYPYTETWNLGVQHVFAKNYTAEIRYVGTRGVDLNVQNRLNVIDVATPSTSLPTYLANPGQPVLDALPNTLAALQSMSHIDPNYAAAGFTTPIVGYMPWGASTYHGLQTQLNRRFTNGFMLQAAYTFSHNIDNSTADFHSTDVTPRRPQDFRNLPGERSNSALDHRHRFSLAAVYDVPFFNHSDNWFKKNVLGNYEVAPTWIYETGEWATVQSGVDSNLNGDNAGDRAIFNPSGQAGLGSDVTALTNTGGDTVAYLANTPTARWIIAGTGAGANNPASSPGLSIAGRNTLQLLPINNWDATIAKHLKFGERFQVDFLAGFLNVFNHPQFIPGSPNQANDISILGRDFLIPNSTTFTQWKSVFPSNVRSTQLGLKLIF
jgi:hypothetical protein